VEGAALPLPEQPAGGKARPATVPQVAKETESFLAEKRGVNFKSRSRFGSSENRPSSFLNVPLPSPVKTCTTQ
jgi:hypothetical protein